MLRDGLNLYGVSIFVKTVICRLTCLLGYLVGEHGEHDVLVHRKAKCGCRYHQDHCDEVRQRVIFSASFTLLLR